MVVDCAVEGMLHSRELPDILAGGARLMMIMPMMRIGIMRVGMRQAFVSIPMAMWTGDGFGMLVLMHSHNKSS